MIPMLRKKKGKVMSMSMMMMIIIIIFLNVNLGRANSWQSFPLQSQTNKLVPFHNKQQLL